MICFALLATIASRAAAQSPGTFGIDAFGRYAHFDDTLGLDNDKFGGGGTLSIYFIRNLALEAEGSYVKSTTLAAPAVDVKSYPLRARLTYNIPLSNSSPTSLRIGAGYVYDWYKYSGAGGAADVDIKNHGATGLVGFRVGLGPTFNIKVDGTVDYGPSPDQVGVDKYWNFGVQAGLGILLGNSYDSDKDGVKNAADRCAKTPAGEQVDENGCAASQRDSDGDHVMDDRDRCANTPAGETVDENGCSAKQLDADSDGVTDAADKCPNTPAGETVDADGCAPSQKDADGDKVADAQDKCPDTPAGETVDANGCGASQKDTDADHVPDASDKCPNTPAGQQVDANGCPILFKGAEKSVTLRGVTFETGKAELRPDAQTILQDVATSLASNTDVHVEVAGYTDNTGSAKTNRRLSQERAQAVADFLTSHGVSQQQIVGVRGYGPANPVASNKSAAGREQNRRVQLNRVK